MQRSTRTLHAAALHFALAEELLSTPEENVVMAASALAIALCVHVAPACDIDAQQHAEVARMCSRAVACGWAGLHVLDGRLADANESWRDLGYLGHAFFLSGRYSHARAVLTGLSPMEYSIEQVVQLLRDELSTAPSRHTSAGTCGTSCAALPMNGRRVGRTDVSTAPSATAAPTGAAGTDTSGSTSLLGALLTDSSPTLEPAEPTPCGDSPDSAHPAHTDGSAMAGPRGPECGGTQSPPPVPRRSQRRVHAQSVLTADVHRAPNGDPPSARDERLESRRVRKRAKLHSVREDMAAHSGDHLHRADLPYAEGERQASAQMREFCTLGNKALTKAGLKAHIVLHQVPDTPGGLGLGLWPLSMRGPWKAGFGLQKQPENKHAADKFMSIRKRFPLGKSFDHYDSGGRTFYRAEVNGSTVVDELLSYATIEGIEEAECPRLWHVLGEIRLTQSHAGRSWVSTFFPHVDYTRAKPAEVLVDMLSGSALGAMGQQVLHGKVNELYVLDLEPSRYELTPSVLHAPAVPPSSGRTDRPQKLRPPQPGADGHIAELSDLVREAKARWADRPAAAKTMQPWVLEVCCCANSPLVRVAVEHGMHGVGLDKNPAYQSWWPQDGGEFVTLDLAFWSDEQQDAFFGERGDPLTILITVDCRTYTCAAGGVYRTKMHPDGRPDLGATNPLRYVTLVEHAWVLTRITSLVHRILQRSPLTTVTFESPADVFSSAAPMRATIFGLCSKLTGRPWTDWLTTYANYWHPLRDMSLAEAMHRAKRTEAANRALRDGRTRFPCQPHDRVHKREHFITDIPKEDMELDPVDCDMGPTQLWTRPAEGLHFSTTKTATEWVARVPQLMAADVLRGALRHFLRVAFGRDCTSRV